MSTPSGPEREPRRAPTPDRRRFLLGGALALVAVACGRAATDAGGTDATTSAPGTTTGSAAGGSSGTTGTTGTSVAGPATTTTTTAAASTTATNRPSTTTAPTTTGAPPSTGSPTAAPFVVNGDRSSRSVALTFHTNGDLQQVRSILDIAEARRVPITAFVVGNWLDANPSMGARLVQGGHEVANHTYTHPTFERLTPAAMATEITRCRDVLARTTGGGGGTWFRLSGTDDGTAAPSAAAMKAAGDAGYRGVVGFDVDPHDYQDPGSKAVVDRTLAAVQAGAIISLHMGHAGTIDALPAILDGLAARQLRPVTLTTLLG